MLKTLNELFPKTENLLFSDLYLKIKEKFRSTGKVTEQMCFISLLHLAAENLYSLNPAFENDFYIKRN